MTEPTDFVTFLEQWNSMQEQDTPALHARIAEWLEIAWEADYNRLLLQVFRAGGKSTIAGLFAAWLLHRQPDLRILVLAADQALAGKMVRQVKRIIERHPATKALLPDKRDQWSSDRFTVKRGLELRDPSMLARGIDANITGSRADIVICDDVEVPNTCDTAEKRRLLRENLAEVTFVTTPGATQLYIGTPHTWFSIYADEARAEIGEDRPFLDGFERLTIPVLDQNGRSAWPERYNDEDIDRIRRASGPNRFASQMMLAPVNIAEGRLDPSQLVFYDADLMKDDALGGLHLMGRRLISCSAWWDPAFGRRERGGDGSVLAIVFTDEDGGFWLQNVIYIECPLPSRPADGPLPLPEGRGDYGASFPLSLQGEGRGEGLDQATQQCRIIAQAAREFHVPSLTVEINGIGLFLPQILRREMARMRVPCAVREFSNSRPKNLRILEGFDALLAARALNVHESVMKTPFLTEMREWRPGAAGHDDGLDAVAGALSQAPARLEFTRFAGRQNWHGRRGAHEARTDFQV